MCNETKPVDLSSAVLRAQTSSAITVLLEQAQLRKGEIVVIGCSTSEIMGGRIGKFSSLEAAQSVLPALLEATRSQGVFLAIQCCEHLNRALVVERECQEKYNLEIVNVRPLKTAGGSMAQMAVELYRDPVVVETIRAHAGMDIGNTIIGMHLRPVVVPLRSEITKIGCAPVVMARTRAKFIGGPRAQYDTDK